LLTLQADARSEHYYFIEQKKTEATEGAERGLQTDVPIFFSPFPQLSPVKNLQFAIKPACGLLSSSLILHPQLYSFVPFVPLW
jgi:hypothetical protein